MSFVKNKILTLLLVSGFVFIGGYIITPQAVEADAYTALAGSNQIKIDGAAAASSRTQDYLNYKDASGKTVYSASDATKKGDELQGYYNDYATHYYDLNSRYDSQGNRVDGKHAEPQKYDPSYSAGWTRFKSIFGVMDGKSQAEIDNLEYKFLSGMVTDDLAKISASKSTDYALIGKDPVTAAALEQSAAALANKGNADLKVATASMNNEPIWCVKGAWTSTPIEFNAVGCAALVSWSMLKFSSWVLGVVAMVFNISIDYTLNFKSFIANRANIVDLGWKSIRDLVNLFFIFILVYIGIGTIINSGTYNKNLLVKVLITAVLLNFSLFFTQVMIDVSNVFSLQFYSKIIANSQTINTNAGNGTLAKDTSVTDTNSGISAALVKSLGLDEIWKLGARSSASTGEDSRSGAFASPNVNAMTLLLYGLGGSIFVLVTAFVLGAAAYMFILRAVTLIFLMILSPIAFAGKILPAADGYSKEWWNKLTSNLIFAPAYMALMYIVLSMVFVTSQNQGTFLKVFEGGSDGAEVAFTFFILIALMWGCLTVAMKTSAAGASGASSLGLKWGRAAQGFATRTIPGYVGRGVSAVGGGALGGAAWAAKGTARAATRATVGGLGYKLANSDGFKGLVGNGRFGGAMLRGADAMANAKIGGRSFKESEEARNKKYARTAELYENTIRRAGESDSDFKARKNANKERADASLGVSVDETTGKTTGTKLGGIFPSTGRARTAAQADRLKSRSRGAEGKIEDQIRDIQHELGETETKNGKTSNIYKRDKDGNEITKDHGAFKKAKDDAEKALPQLQKDIDAQLKIAANTSSSNLEKMGASAAAAALQTKLNEFKADIRAANDKEAKLKDLLVRKDQAGK